MGHSAHAAAMRLNLSIAVLGLLLSAGTASASTFDISLTPNSVGNGILTGTIDIENGLFNSLILGGGCIITGDPGSCEFQYTVSPNPNFTWSPTPGVTDYYTDSILVVQTGYDFKFGDRDFGQLDLNLSPFGFASAAYTDYDNESCSGDNCLPTEGLAFGTMTTTPLPSTLPLLATALGLLYCSRRIRHREAST